MKQKKEFDYLIVGAGLFGSVFAERAKEAGKRCLVIEKRNHIGGNVYCEEIGGINVHKYGAHILHTDNKNVWDYLNSFVEFNRYTNSPLACYKGVLYNLPFNMNTFRQLWGVSTPLEAKAYIEKQRKAYYKEHPANLEEQALKLCGEDIYVRFIKGYTEKQWGRKATELPAFIINRIPFRFTYDNNYFNDSFQGIPKGGFNPLISNLLKETEVRLDINYIEHRKELDQLASKVVFTGCIDEFFNFCFGRLEYRSLRFEHEHLQNTDNYQGNAVVNYTEREVPYTRIIEHKHFEFGTQPTTVITHEYPDGYMLGKEPYYPVNNAANTKLLNQYKELANQYPAVIFGGRLAQYAYFDMDDTVEQALKLAEKELLNGRSV